MWINLFFILSLWGFILLFPHFTNGKAESQVVQNCEVSEILPYLHGNKLVRHYFVELYRRRQWHPTPVLLPGKSHGRRSLVGCRPWDREESDRTERLHFHFSLSCIGEGNGNPLQCSCLENPRDRGACWAAVYGVTQSWTRLKQLSSSSSNYIFCCIFPNQLTL